MEQIAFIHIKFPQFLHRDSIFRGLHLNGLKKPPVLQRRMHEDEKKTETVSGSSSTQVLTYMRVACTDTHVMWARLLGDTVRPCGVTSQR
ncbi:uncharacterized protein LOC105286443 isoform X2 [Ooceraea biroi]|uniref:uncharacterized protein LOC105286443 isoform X2 n=1 Tax=Ooceraea biroi TaxID=2015173 RepID=UPI0005B9307C|nr:uncharacterized protein LOC105286443 isoform X2 [Ooceraea biroi]